MPGVLDQLNSIIQIDLHGNPWDCSCNIVPFKQWTDKLGADVIVSDLKCESPEEFWKRDFRRIRNDLMCPQLYEKISPTSLSKNSTLPADTGTRPNSYLEPSRVSISVLVPGLLLVFVTSAFTVVGMLVFILRNRKRSKRRDGNSSASEINSLQTVCDSSYWHSGAYHADAPHRGFDCGAHSLSDKWCIPETRASKRTYCVSYVAVTMEGNTQTLDLWLTSVGKIAYFLLLQLSMASMKHCNGAPTVIYV